MDKQHEMKGILKVSNDMKDSKYLGLPLFVGKSKKFVFNYVKERIWRKVQDCNHKNLSKDTFSFGMVIRDDQDKFVKGKICAFLAVMEAEVREVQAAIFRVEEPRLTECLLIVMLLLS
ncbi:hypothetical protein AgCh_008352 [Apium graveolens]